MLKGVMWRIGNGCSIHYWLYPWFPLGVIIREVAIAPNVEPDLHCLIVKMSDGNGN